MALLIILFSCTYSCIQVMPFDFICSVFQLAIYKLLQHMISFFKASLWYDFIIIIIFSKVGGC